MPAPKSEGSPPKPRPSKIGLKIVELLQHDGFGFTIENESSVLLHNPGYSVALFDLDLPDPAATTLTGAAAQDLRQTNISPRKAVGPFSMTNNTIPPAKQGDRLFGWVTVDCENCERSRTFWFYGVQGEAGWFAEVKRGLHPAMGAIEAQLLAIRENPEPFLDQLPLQSPRQSTVSLP